MNNQVSQDRVRNLEEWKLSDYENYNDRFDRGAFRGSEATKFKISAIKRWLSIKDELTYTDDTSGEGWKYLDIKDGWHSKYGLNFILIHPEKKLWRIKLTGDEFYNGPTDPLE